MLESLAAASYDGRLYSLSSSTGDKECTKDSCRRLGARTLGCERVCIFAVREQSCVALRRTCAALLRAARSPQTRETVLQRDALEAASCVLRTSTESTVLQGCLMRVAALTTLVAGARAMSLKAGAQVPKFAVTAHTGAAVSSDSLAGSAYCLWFYPKADTGG